MDLPVIVDEASKFGREIDLDRLFPAFPFDDVPAGFFVRPRDDGIRAHLDDLAARHPELAEHLRGPPAWPFSGSLLRDRRHRRRGSGGSSNDGQQHQQPNQQHQVDEDARSQTSGTSAASGASAVSSHSGGEPDLTSSSTIPQYGLRNTVDIGQQQRRRKMETSPEKNDRGQRSMSAPPENRQQQEQEQYDQDQQQQPGQGQRFVSRVDITPQHNQQQRSQSPSKPRNVRHIPIFVEGRDEPVISRLTTDDTPPPAFHHHQREPSPPYFHRPSHFDEHFGRQQWPPSHFQSPFYEAAFEPRRHQQTQYYQQQPQYHRQRPQHHQQEQHTQQPQYQQHKQQEQQHQEQQHEEKQQEQQHEEKQQEKQQEKQEIPKPKPPPVPKDALVKVAEIQKEVDNLAEQVQCYVGGSRQDKQYIYLDEMLTRELLKLDDIETEGRENVRQARKNAIKTIQDTISLLESKAPLADQQEQQSVMQECSEEKDQQEEKTSQTPELMDVEQEKQESNEPIPLPPSPTKMKVESSENESAATITESANQNVASTFQQDTKIDEKSEQKIENRAAENTEQQETNDGKDDMMTQNKDMTPQQMEETKKEKTAEESPSL